MTHYFLDSSALVKRHINEPGTNWIRTIIHSRSGNRILIAQITPVEVVSAVMRRQREGLITARTSLAVRMVVDRQARRDYEVIGFTPEVALRAEDLLERHSLRAYDAVQLASALEVEARFVPGETDFIRFVSADNRLSRAADDEGLITINPSSMA